ncbi:MAG: chromate transporter [Erysipelotrichaceae bacterium]|nr:chromate transporter [Erysipelotrichaceae bacterium]
MISILEIFLNFLKIGLFAFGGAYAVIPLIEEQMVTNTGWMTFTEFSDLVAIDELTPGPIIINSSTFIGMKLAGVPGAIAATLACVIPGAIIALTLVWLYQKYKEIPVINEAIRVLKCMSVALIFSVLIKMFLSAVFPEGIAALKEINIPSLIMVIVSFYVLKKFKTNPLFVMLACGCITLLLSFLNL